MTTEHGAAKYHVAAAFHHQQAMEHHLRIARYSMIQDGQPYSTQQTSLAYSHALRALEDGNSSHRYYARYDHHGLPNFPEFVSCVPGEPVVPIWKTGSGGKNAEHHIAAARHHGHSAQYHRKASLHCTNRDYTPAIHAAKIAHSHARQALFHADMGIDRFGMFPDKPQDIRSDKIAEWMGGSDMMPGLFGARKMTRKLGHAAAVPQS